MKIKYTLEELKEIRKQLIEARNEVTSYLNSNYRFVCNILHGNHLSFYYFRNNKPTKSNHRRYYKNKYFEQKNLHDDPWWTSGKEGNKQRVKFLNYLINKLTKQILKYEKDTTH